MLSRRHFALSLAAACALAPGAARAAPEVNYTDAAFDAAQKAGKPIVVVVHAPWCPTCKAQKPTLSKLEEDPKFSAIVVFHVDFDSQPEVLRRFGVRTQSTLVAFKGDTEKGRSVGVTDPAAIAALFEATL